MPRTPPSATSPIVADPGEATVRPLPGGCRFFANRPLPMQWEFPNVQAHSRINS